jgi:hypothetical protein
MTTTTGHAMITATVMEHTDGRPIAYIDATSVAVFAYQQLDGSYVVAIDTRDDEAADRLHVLIDGRVMDLTGHSDGQPRNQAPLW